MKPFHPQYGLTDEYRCKVVREAQRHGVREAAEYFRLSTTAIYTRRKRMSFEPNQVVSTGTLRPEDLIPTFARAVGPFLPPALASDIRRWTAGAYPDHVIEVAEAEILEQLEEELCRLAPEGTYFGAHEGDGACFGFWELP